MASGASLRYFEFKDAKSAKFWEAVIEGASVKVRYGKIGSDGQTQVKAFPDADAAQAHASKLIAEKIGKGYVECNDGGHTSQEVVPTKATVANVPADKAAAPAKKAPTANPAKDPEASPESLRALLDKDDATNRLLAAHSKADAKLLETLSHSSDPATRKAVCLNANASKEVLLRLAPQFPGEFFRNPAFDWLLLEDPNLLLDLGQGVLKNILKRPDCPASFIDWAVKHGSEQERLAVAMNPNASADAIGALSKRKGTVGEAAKGRKAPKNELDLEQIFDEEVCKALAGLEEADVKSTWKRRMIGPAQWRGLSFRCRASVLGLDPSVFAVGAMPQEAERLAAEEDAEVRAIVAGHAETPTALVDRLIVDRVAEVRAAVARNPSVTDECLSKLFEDRSPAVRIALAGHPRAGADRLRALAADKSPEVRQAVAQARSVPHDVLEALAKETTRRVRECASELLAHRLKSPAADSRTSPEKLLELVASKVGTVRAAVAGNPSAPEAALRALLGDPNPAVGQQLAGNAMAPADVREAAYRALVEAAGPIKLKSYVEDPECPSGLRQFAAARLWMTSSKDWFELTAVGLARQKLRISADGLLKMGALDLTDAFRSDCQHFLSSPASTQFASAFDESAVHVVDAEVADACAASTVPAVRLLGLAHRRTAPELLIKRFKSTNWVDRLAVARNPSVPVNLLAVLKKDAHLAVAQQAVATEAVKAGDRDDQEQVISATSGAIDLGPAIDAVCAGLRSPCRAWQLAGTPWWNALKFEQRLEGDVQATVLSTSLSREFLASVPNSLVRRAVARDDQTSVELLEKLSVDCDEWVRSSVGANASTPITILERLATDQATNVRCAVAENGRSPVKTLLRLAGDEAENVRDCVTRNPSATSEVLVALASRATPSKQLVIAMHPSSTQALLETLVAGGDADVIGWVTSRPNAPASVLTSLYKSKDERKRCSVACHSRTGESVLRELAVDPSSRVRSEVAGNPLAPASVLSDLARDKESLVRSRLASNPAASSQILELLSRGDQSLRCEVASNRSATEELLKRLAADKYPSVRERVARNPKINQDIASLLAADSDDGVRIQLTGNPNLEPKLLEVLAADSAHVVRKAVAGNSQTPEEVLNELAKDSDVSVCIAVAKHPRAPIMAFERLAASADRYIRFELFQIAHAPTKVIRSLEGDTDDLIRAGVASSTQASEEALRRLARDQDSYFRYKVAENRAAPWDVLHGLAKLGPKYISDKCSIASQCRRYVEHARRAAEDAETSIDTLRALASRGYWSIRFAALNNPSMPAVESIAGAKVVWTEIEEALRAGGAASAPATVSIDDLVTALQAMDLLPDASDRKAVAAAAKSSDALARLGAVLSKGLQPAQLRLLLDDPNLTVRQLAAQQLKH